MNKMNKLLSAQAIADHGGRLIKHPALIRNDSIPGCNELAKKKLTTIGIDIESNYKTGSIELLGLHDGKKYWYYESNFRTALEQIVDYYEFNEGTLINWSRFDPTQLFKILIKGLPLSDQFFACQCYGNISGEWDKKAMAWDQENPPIIEVKVGERKYLGIKMAIRSNLQMYVRTEGSEHIGAIWCFNVAPFYQESLEPTAKKFFDWYSKIDEESHLLDDAQWDRFHDPKNDEDRKFRAKVLLSNELDSKASKFLGDRVIDEFANVFFGKYPKNLISTGALTRSAIAGFTENKYKEIKGKEFRQKVAEELQSIAITYYENDWRKQIGDEKYKEFIHACYAVYKGAIIECYGYGYFEKAFTADLHSAYVGTEIKLPDLRGAIIDLGEGVPPEQKENEIVFCEGDATIPEDCNHHPLLIRNPIHPEGNLRPTGIARTCYFYEERILCESIGITFQNEKWYRIKTTGKRSIIAECAEFCQKDRVERQKNNDPNYIRSKQVVLGIYGDLFEGTKIQIVDKGKIVFNGIRAGKYLMPLLAGLVTMQTRCKICRASLAIEKNGGRTIFSQTDSMMWEGTENDLPREMIANNPKIPGMFDGVEEVRDLISLGAGRYEYLKKDKKTGTWTNYTAKSRGFFLDEIENDEGVILEDIGWRDCLRNLIKERITKEKGKRKPKIIKDKIMLRMKTLITPGMIVSNHDFAPDDIGRIMIVEKLVDPISGRNKRRIDPIKNLEELADRHVWSKPIPIGRGLMVGENMIDDTLPELKQNIVDIDLKSEEKTNVKKDRKKDEQEKSAYRQKYFLLRKHGFEVNVAKNYAGKDWDAVLEFVRSGGKIKKLIKAKA